MLAMVSLPVLRGKVPGFSLSGHTTVPGKQKTPGAPPARRSFLRAPVVPAQRRKSAILNTQLPSLCRPPREAFWHQKTPLRLLVTLPNISVEFRTRGQRNGPCTGRISGLFIPCIVLLRMEKESV